MADNTELSAGSGGDTIATDDIAGVKHQRVKISLGADGAATDALGGAGAVAAGVQRVTLASDDPAVALLTTIDADTGNLAGILTAVQTLDDAIAGSEMQVDVVSSALPTGASTAAKQPALGTAGTASADVISVQGIASMTPVQVSDAGGSLTVDNGGTFAVQVSSIAAGNNNIGDVDIASIAAGDNNIGNVDIVTMPNVTLAAGTNTNEVVGDAAHDAAVAGNPVQVGGYATNAIEGVTQVAAGDLTRQVHDLNGVQVVRPHTTLEELLSERVTNTDGASTALSTFGAGGSGVHNYITQVTLWNSSATDGFVDLRDGTAGSVKYTLPAPQTGGCAISFDPPLKFADNTAVAFDASGAISTIYLSFNGFQAQG